MLFEGDTMPSVDGWLKEVKDQPDALENGMVLVHNGVVRKTPRAQVRQGVDDGSEVRELSFSYDRAGVLRAIEGAQARPGIFSVRVWLAEGRLAVGDDIMLVLVAGDIRPHVIDALQALVETIKTQCVREVERFS